MKESNAIKVVCKNRLLVFFDLNKLIVNYLTRTFINNNLLTWLTKIILLLVLE